MAAAKKQCFLCIFCIELSLHSSNLSLADWDCYICPLLFAYRDMPQSSTGFSPFELLYGRTVRGPMTILSELWTSETDEGEAKNTYQYIMDLQNVRDVLTDVPGKTNLGEHKIELTDDVPIRCKPYPIPHAVRGDTMLEMGIIRESSSPYACPLTVVAKPDGSSRICCDTRC